MTYANRIGLSANVCILIYRKIPSQIVEGIFVFRIFAEDKLHLSIKLK